jgi:hypothetical protein
MNPLELSLAGKDFQIAPGGGLTDRKLRTKVCDRHPLSLFDQMQDMVLSFNT